MPEEGYFHEVSERGPLEFELLSAEMLAIGYAEWAVTVKMDPSFTQRWKDLQAELKQMNKQLAEKYKQAIDAKYRLEKKEEL
jgi:hypothetical protein